MQCDTGEPDTPSRLLLQRRSNARPEDLDPTYHVIAEFGDVAMTNLATLPRLRTLDVANLTLRILQ